MSDYIQDYNVSDEIESILNDKGYDGDCENFSPGLSRYYKGINLFCAGKWLRQKKKLHVEAIPLYGYVEIGWRHGEFEEELMGWGYIVIELEYNNLKEKYDDKKKPFKSFEEAYESAIEVCCKKYI